MATKMIITCELCDREVPDQSDLAQFTLGGEVEMEICEGCLAQVYARVKNLLDGSGILQVTK